jgi:hypothetical protein
VTDNQLIPFFKFLNEIKEKNKNTNESIYGAISDFFESDKKNTARLAHSLLSVCDTRGKSKIGWQLGTENYNIFVNICKEKYKFDFFSTTTHDIFRNYIFRTSEQPTNNSTKIGIFVCISSILADFSYDEKSKSVIKNHQSLIDVVSDRNIFNELNDSFYNNDLERLKNSPVNKIDSYNNSADILSRLFDQKELYDEDMFDAFYSVSNECDIDQNFPYVNYIVYRLASQKDKIVKSYLQIRSPNTKLIKYPFFSFAHYYYDGLRIKKRTWGPVIKIGRNIYLGGATAKMSKTASLTPEALEFNVIDIGKLRINNSIVRCLSLTSNNSFEPIISRSVMIKCIMTNSDECNLGSGPINL